MIISNGFSDTGKIRELNEDFWLTHTLSAENGVFYAMVADGMGGHNAGEVASKLAVTCTSDYINTHYSDSLSYQEVKALVISAVEAANAAVYTESVSDSLHMGMGTTLTLCFFLKKRVIIAHIGDSRLYIIRKNALHKITRDHSLVEELVRQGQITEEEALTHPQKNVITRALGTDETADVDIYELEANDKDIFIICSDGLSNMVSAFDLGKIVLESGDLLLAPIKLVEKANAKGGTDNITAVCMQFIDNFCENTERTEN